MPLYPRSKEKGDMPTKSSPGKLFGDKLKDPSAPSALDASVPSQVDEYGLPIPQKEKMSFGRNLGLSFMNELLPGFADRATGEAAYKNLLGLYGAQREKMGMMNLMAGKNESEESQFSQKLAADQAHQAAEEEAEKEKISLENKKVALDEEKAKKKNLHEQIFEGIKNILSPPTLPSPPALGPSITPQAKSSSDVHPPLPGETYAQYRKRIGQS